MPAEWHAGETAPLELVAAGTPARSDRRRLVAAD
jgi:hypothetical protein